MAGLHCLPLCSQPRQVIRGPPRVIDSAGDLLSTPIAEYDGPLAGVIVSCALRVPILKSSISVI